MMKSFEQKRKWNHLRILKTKQFGGGHYTLNKIWKTPHTKNGTCRVLCSVLFLLLSLSFGSRISQIAKRTQSMDTESLCHCLSLSLSFSVLCILLSVSLSPHFCPKVGPKVLELHKTPESSTPVRTKLLARAMWKWPLAAGMKWNLRRREWRSPTIFCRWTRVSLRFPLGLHTGRTEPKEKAKATKNKLWNGPRAKPQTNPRWHLGSQIQRAQRRLKVTQRHSPWPQRVTRSLQTPPDQKDKTSTSQSFQGATASSACSECNPKFLDTHSRESWPVLRGTQDELGVGLTTVLRGATVTSPWEISELSRGKERRKRKR